MAQPILWYFADPMCSWCWGFTPTIEAIRDEYRDRLRIALVPGGLRPGTTEPMTQAAREETLHHWHAVHERTGQPFRFDDVLPEGFVYDTEPASRALVAAGKVAPAKVFALMKAIQQAFYTEGRDVTREAELMALAQAQGVDGEAFLVAWREESTREATRAQFMRARQAGVRGFPTLILEQEGMRQRICDGCLPLAVVREGLDRALAGT